MPTLLLRTYHGSKFLQFDTGSSFLLKIHIIIPNILKIHIIITNILKIHIIITNILKIHIIIANILKIHIIIANILKIHIIITNIPNPVLLRMKIAGSFGLTPKFSQNLVKTHSQLSKRFVDKFCSPCFCAFNHLN